MNTPRVIRLNGEDNVVIAIDLVNQGDPAHGLTARQRIHKGHKMAIEPIREGEPVRKFGQIIGFAKTHIAPGEWVHEHNVGLHDFARDYRFAEDAQDDGLLPEDMRATFEGYRRPNGRAGTRNYIGILTTRELLGIGRALCRRGGRALGRARRLPGRRRHRRDRARHRLRPCRLWRGLRGPAPHAMGLRQPSELRRRRHGRPRLRGVPDRPHEEGIRAHRDRHLPHHDDPGDRRHEEDRRGDLGRDPRHAADRGRGAPRDAPRLRARARPAMRRLGRLFGDHREPGARRGVRPSRPPRRHLDPVRDARDLRRRASPDAARRDPRDRREARLAHPLVGGLHGARTAAR